MLSFLSNQVNFWDWPLSRDCPGTWASADSAQRKRWLQAGTVPLDYPGRTAEDFPELLRIVREKVKPEREKSNRAVYRNNWWQFAEKRPALYHAIGRGNYFARHPEGWNSATQAAGQVIAFTLHSKYWCPDLVDTSRVFTHALGIVANGSAFSFAVLQSSFHTEWGWKTGSSLESRLRYTPSDVYETFPFPDARAAANVSVLGERYQRARTAARLSLDIGLTDLYNCFHDPNSETFAFVELRKLHEQLDVAVRDAYGWNDLDLGHGFQAVPYLPENDRTRFAISEPARLQILRRLSSLNRERWQAEQDAAAAAHHDVDAAREAIARKRGEGRPAFKLVSPPQQTRLF